MHISFNGVIVPYTYHCPHAHRLRNIERVVIPPREDQEEGLSRRQLGIELHNAVAAYLTGNEDTFAYMTPTIQHLRELDDETILITELQEFYDLDFTPLDQRPKSGDYISMRADAVEIAPSVVRIYDWKFGNSEYGASRYYDETEFFLACKASHTNDVQEWEVYIHFPIDNYTLPVRKYTALKAAQIQSRYIERIERIRNDRQLVPKPSRARCKFCDYRSYDNGGSGHCAYSVE
jgi:CRISPR/Cas system-associated exonuclease Cas4 (RecB family)